ncbi:MAG TPA: class I SAM-dependent methyltransferase [Nitrospiraceae bacterium]
MSHENADDKNMIPLTKHKRNVAKFFSGRTVYWRQIYDSKEESISQYYHYFMEKRKAAVLAALDRFSDGKPIKVLDAGCGPGALLEEVAKRGHTATGLDFSLDMVAQASWAVGNAGTKRTCFIQGDLDSLPFKDNSFDAVICVGVLQYLPDNRMSISELGRVLRPDGIAIITLPNLLRMNNLLDPIYYFRGLKYVVHLLSKKLPIWKTPPDPVDFSTNEMFSNRRYYYGQLGGDFRRSNLGTVDVVCIGFGPLTFWRRPLLSERLSLSISDRIERASGRPGFRWLGVFSNRWVISLRKAA